MKNFISRVKRIFRDKGFLLTLGLSFSLLLFFYGKLFFHPCTTYFGKDGDGLQTYYETLYHIKYDPHYWSQRSINYPYGESILFTSALPFVNNVAKIFGPNAGPLGVGLVNLMMLFSPVIGAIFLYGIFRRLKLPWMYSAVAASAVAFLSPQMARMSGHYTLAWVFLIPAMFYLLLKFYDAPDYNKSFFISALVFIGASTHLYFFAFYSAMIGGYWFVLYCMREPKFKNIFFALKHVVIQLLIPFFILQLLMMSTENIQDRTIAPCGFLTYRSNFAGVYFPFGKPYESLARSFIDPEKLESEGVAYIGLAAIIGLIAIIFFQFTKLFRKKFKSVMAVTENKVLDIFFWTSLILLWISFGHPFIDRHQDWLPYIGPFRQFRAIGRFTWLFFYIINIVAVYRLYCAVKQRKKLSYVVMAAICFLLCVDMFYNNAGMQDKYNNRELTLEDEQNNLPENSWLKNFNPSAYQAILALPYFHIGSENIIHIPNDADIVKWSYIVSLKTGLPLMDVSSSRVSIGETIKLTSLVLEPNRKFAVMNDFPDQRPLLLLVRDSTLDENEKRIVAVSKLLAQTKNYKIYSLELSELENIPQMHYESEKKIYLTKRKFPVNNFESTDSTGNFIFLNTENLCKKIPSENAGISFGVFDSSIAIPGNYLVSFWYKKIDCDIFPRTTINAIANDTISGPNQYRFFSNFSPLLKSIDGAWGLIEFPLTITKQNSPVKITLHNDDLKKTDSLVVNNLLIRPENADIYKLNGDTIWKNNRQWIPQQ